MSNRNPQLQHRKALVHRCYTARDNHLYRVHTMYVLVQSRVVTEQQAYSSEVRQPGQPQ
jgi:hypothetical protein